MGLLAILGTKGEGAIAFPNIGISEFKLNNVALPKEWIGIDIYWYAVIIATGFLLAIFLALHLAKRTSISQDNLLDGILWVTPFAIICARLYYVIFDPEKTYNSFLEIINIRSGGIAIYGGVIGAVIGAFVFTKIRKINLLELLDITAPCFLLGQAIGRWGNFFNQEAYGGETNLPWAMQLYINGEKVLVHPTFLYESIINFVGLAILLYIFKRRTSVGQVAFTYLIWYGIGRFFVESLRTDQLMILNIPVSMIVAFLSVIAGIIGLVYLKKNKKEIDNGDNN